MGLCAADIVALWAKGRLPILDGLAGADGHFWPVAVARPEAPAPRVGAVQPLQGLALTPQVEYSSIDGFAKAEWDGWVVYCGGGSMGGDGYIYAERDGSFCWVFFHSGANPFERLAIQDGRVRALNNMGAAWVFDLRTPQAMRVARQAW